MHPAAVLAAFDMLRFRVLLKDFFSFLDFFGRVFIILELTRQELLVGAQVNQSVTAKVKQNNLFFAFFFGFLGNINYTSSAWLVSGADIKPSVFATSMPAS